MNVGDAEILEKAADLLETVGHCKDAYFTMIDEHGNPINFLSQSTKPEIVSYCAIGAIRAATGIDLEYYLGSTLEGGTEEKFRTSERVIALVGDYIGYSYIPDWNDEPDRTADDVIDTFKMVAKDLRNGA